MRWVFLGYSSTGCCPSPEGGISRMVQYECVCVFSRNTLNYESCFVGLKDGVR